MITFLVASLALVAGVFIGGILVAGAYHDELEQGFVTSRGKAYVASRLRGAPTGAEIKQEKAE